MVQIRLFICFRRIYLSNSHRNRAVQCLHVFNGPGSGPLSLFGHFSYPLHCAGEKAQGVPVGFCECKENRVLRNLGSEHKQKQDCW